jgi:hypothetical protein
MPNQEPEPLARLRLKLDINRALMTCHNGEYLSQFAFRFRCVPKDRWELALDELEQEGVLKRICTRRGAVVIVRCVMGQPVHPETLIEDALPDVYDRTEQRKLNSVETSVYRDYTAQ